LNRICGSSSSRRSRSSPEGDPAQRRGRRKDQARQPDRQSRCAKRPSATATSIHDTTGWDGIWVAKPDPDYLATLVDGEDKLLTKVDMQGGEVMTTRRDRRAKDDAFLGGFFGDMITGKQGTTLNAFPAANVARRFPGAGRCHRRRRHERAEDPPRAPDPRA
jgi:hypothetical protein